MFSDGPCSMTRHQLNRLHGLWQITCKENKLKHKARTQRLRKSFKPTQKMILLKVRRGKRHFYVATFCTELLVLLQKTKLKERVNFLSSPLFQDCKTKHQYWLSKSTPSTTSLAAKQSETSQLKYDDRSVLVKIVWRKINSKRYSWKVCQRKGKNSSRRW